MVELRYSPTILALGTRWSGQLHASTALPAGKLATANHGMGGWVGPRLGLVAVVKNRAGNLTTTAQPVSRPYTDSYYKQSFHL
jgi:hypothetical protein